MLTLRFLCCGPKVRDHGRDKQEHCWKPEEGNKAFKSAVRIVSYSVEGYGKGQGSPSSCKADD